MNGELRRSVRAVWWGWKAEFSGAAEYRADLVSGTLVSAVWLGIAVAPMLVVSAHNATAPGWTLPRLLFLQAIWYLVDAVVWMVIMTNARELSWLVRDGSLDAVLLRPVSSLVMCSLGRVYVQDVPKVGLGLGLATVAAVQGGGPASAWAAMACLVSVGCACVLMWSVGVLANYKALTKVQFNGTFGLLAAHDLARIPTPLYGRTLRIVLTAVVPVAFLTTVPAQLFFGAVPIWWVLLAVGLAAVAVRGTSWLWHRELRGYTGAMS